MLQTLIKHDYPTITSLSAVNTIKHLLIQYKAAIVIDEEGNNCFLGMLTPEDMLEKPYQLVVDCISAKPLLDSTDTKISALKKMIEHKVEALPFFNKGHLEGLVFKDDLIKCLELEIAALEQSLKGGKVFLKSVSSHQSHYLRSPIANLIGLGEVLRLADTVEEQQNAIKMMIHCAAQADSALNAIQQIVDQQISLYTKK